GLRIGARLQTEFEVRGFAENSFGFGGVLNTGQFDDDAIAALALYQRLGDTEFVDAIAQRGQVLADGVILDFLDLGRRHRPGYGDTIRARFDLVLEVRVFLGGSFDRLVGQLLVLEFADDGVAAVFDETAHALITQFAFDASG